MLGIDIFESAQEGLRRQAPSDWAEAAEIWAISVNLHVAGRRRDLAFFNLAILSRLTRWALVEVLEEDYVRTARAKGLKEATVLFKHALNNSLIPTLTVLGPLSAALITGSFVVEYIFAIPGMGRFFITAVTDRDYPMIMGVTLVYTGLLVSANFFVDLLYSIVDPRIKSH